MHLKQFNSLLHLLINIFQSVKLVFTYKLYYLMGIFYVLFIYVLQGYFGKWTKKSCWRLWSSVQILPLLRTAGHCSPDVWTVQKLVFQFYPSNDHFSSRAYIRHFSKHFYTTSTSRTYRKRRDQTQESFHYCYIIC